MANDLDVEKFIQAVRLRGPLWNKNDNLHRNFEVANCLWNQVAKEMGGNLTASELKQKWHNLRDCFRREVRTEEAGRKKKKWIYYSQMLFLLTPDEDMKPEGAKTNSRRIFEQDEYGPLFSTKIEPPDDIARVDLAEIDSNNYDFIEAESISHENDECSLSQDNQSELKKNGEQVSLPTPAGECAIDNKNMEDRNPRTCECSKRDTDSPDNEDYHFAMSIVPHMRNVPVHRKLWMRIKISEIIAEESGYNKNPS